MFKTILRKFQKNPFEKLLKQAAENRAEKFLLVWNRGLGDLPLGLYAMIKRIRQYIPNAEITFIGREALKEGFLLLEGVKYIPVSIWKRRQPVNLQEALDCMNIAVKNFDVVIENPDPTYWVKWQLGKIVPRLKWHPSFDTFYQGFSLDENAKYVGVQIKTDSGHSLWRDWPVENWNRLFQQLKTHSNLKVLLFGLEKDAAVSFENVIDLRGKTTVLQMLSIIKNKCSYLVLPDGGILSLIYYLDVDFPIKIVSLWNDVQGILKQKVPSPNPSLKHIPLTVRGRLQKISAQKVINKLLP